MQCSTGRLFLLGLSVSLALAACIEAEAPEGLAEVVAQTAGEQTADDTETSDASEAVTTSGSAAESVTCMGDERVGEACYEGKGRCRRTGNFVCTSAGVVCELEGPVPKPAAELCGTGEDEDCDGETDEAPDGRCCDHGDCDEGSCLFDGDANDAGMVGPVSQGGLCVRGADTPLNMDPADADAGVVESGPPLSLIEQQFPGCDEYGLHASGCFCVRGACLPTECPDNSDVATTLGELSILVPPTDGTSQFPEEKYIPACVIACATDAHCPDHLPFCYPDLNFRGPDAEPGETSGCFAQR